MKQFDPTNERLARQFESPAWIEGSGIPHAELEAAIAALTEDRSGTPRCILKARAFETVLTRARIAIDPDDIFQDKLDGYGLIERQRWAWQYEVLPHHLPELLAEKDAAYACGAYAANTDFGHTSPNTRLLLAVGFTGLLSRIEDAAKRATTQKQIDFYESCRICLSAIPHFLSRLATAVEAQDSDSAAALRRLSVGAPTDVYEAMQLLIVYFFLHEYIFGTRVRTLGRLDVLLQPFYDRDLSSGRYTKDEIREMLKFFFHKFWSAKVAFDLPLCIGGIDADGREVTGELTYLLVDTYDSLNIHSPKIHVRVSEKTPPAFVRRVLDCIRRGNSSFVFVNDSTVIAALTKVGIKERDAMDYVPIGCYEPAVWGKEIACTGNGGVNLAKAIELTFTNGVDLASGRRITPALAPITDYDGFLAAVKAHVAAMAERMMESVTAMEAYYGEIGPDPILSAMYDHSVACGVDVMEGGAEYNNSSCYFYCIGSAIDAICAVRRLVYEDRRLSLAELGEILKRNWEGEERLRLIAQALPEKYGNGNPVADALTRELSDFCSALINNRKNGRGGVFRASSFSIDRFVYYGAHTMATPDGRHAGDVLSKNLCATVGQDKNGVTALIRSATEIDHTRLPNGTVLDIVLHPSAVAGEEGLSAFAALLSTYFARGGLALHGNVFSAQTLKEAQKHPEQYKNLQVRVCGWNAYFVNLSKVEQDCFIRQAEEKT